MKLHISSLLGLDECRHELIDFVDINIKDDQKLFIDPVLINIQKDEWCEKASLIIDDFFRVFYDVYRENEYIKKHELLTHAGEINHSKLGYGDGINGHGNTAGGLIDVFHELEGLVQRISSISKVIDLPILVKGFNEDGLSDLITNIIHKELNDYTLECLAQYGIESNCTDEFYTWDIQNSFWLKIEAPCFEYEGEKILLTPKRIVRKNYLFSADQYMKRIILERKKDESSYVNDAGKLSKIPKIELIKHINKANDNWRYMYIVDETINDNTYLEEYHGKINKFYLDMGMSDTELDSFIY